MSPRPRRALTRAVMPNANKNAQQPGFPGAMPCHAMPCHPPTCSALALMRSSSCSHCRQVGYSADRRLRARACGSMQVACQRRGKRRIPSDRGAYPCSTARVMAAHRGCHGWHLSPTIASKCGAACVHVGVGTPRKAPDTKASNGCDVPRPALR